MSVLNCMDAIHRYGLSNGTRFLRNRGVPFDKAYFAAFGKYPVR